MAATRAGSVLAPSDADAALVAGFISAFNLRDLGGMLAALHPEVEFHPLRVLGMDKRYDGHADVERWFARLVALEHEHRIVVSAFDTTPTGGIVAAGQLEIGNEATPVHFCGVYRLHDWLIVSAHHYMSDRATLDDLGMAK